MPHHKSAIKRMIQNRTRRARNRANRSALRTQIKKLRGAIDAGNQDGAKQLLQPTLSIIDRSVKKGVLHARAAARYKSRLTRHVNHLMQPAAE